eukprot:11936683-Prorocentrum_lima.AAC.1
MTSSLVGSEMCIRDRDRSGKALPSNMVFVRKFLSPGNERSRGRQDLDNTCLLYTSDAADDM